MTNFQNDDFQRKSTVYNQTGQTYFEQLSAFNRMSAHLRRILKAQRVIDSRNKKYMREKRLASRSSNSSKAIDQIIARRDLVDEVAYDTEHHPIDLLRMKLGCNPYCPQRAKKRVLEPSYRSCCNIQCRSVSPRTTRRIEINPDIIRNSRTNRTGQNFDSDRYSVKSPKLTRRRTNRKAEDDNLSRKNDYDDRIGRINRNVEVTDETYHYDSSFESETTEMDSPVTRKIDFSLSHQRPASGTGNEGKKIHQKSEKISGNTEPNEEAKYAKFVYDITQEIVSNGLYTDHDLRETFKKHVKMNLENLDRAKMLSEISQLKKSLNMKEHSDDDDENENEKGLGLEKIVSTPLAKSSTILRDKKMGKRLKEQKNQANFDDQTSEFSETEINTNRELLISEDQVLSTLLAMKLDPQQVRTICKSLRNRSKETTPLHTIPCDGITPKALNCRCQWRKKKGTSGFPAKDARRTEARVETKNLGKDDEKPEMGIQTSRMLGKTESLKTTMSLNGITTEARGMRLSSSQDDGQPDAIISSKKDDDRATNGGELRLEGAETLRTSSSWSKTKEKMEITKNRSEESMKKSTSSRSIKSSTLQNGQTNKNDSSSISKSMNELNDKLDQTLKIYEKSESPEKSENSSIGKTNIDRNSDASIIGKEDESREIMREKSGEPDIDISEETEATVTNIPTERVSEVSADREENDEITDEELASLTEDISRMDDSRIVENSSPVLNTESEKKSHVPLTTERSIKPKSILSPSSDMKFENIVDESEEAELYAIDKINGEISKNSKSLNKEMKIKVREDEKDEAGPRSDESETSGREELGESSVSTINDGDEIKTRYDDETSVSERLENGESLVNEDRLIGTESIVANVLRTKNRSADLKKYKRADKSMVNVPKKGDKNSNKKKQR